MSALASKEIRLRSRPKGMPTADNFELAASPAPEPGEGQIRVVNHYMSVDPYMRGRMNDRKSYVPPFQIGQALQGGAVGVVEASRHPDYQPGDKVESMMGWREAWTSDPASALARKLPKMDIPDSYFLGVAGMPGMTAYAGLMKVGQAKPGETVFVSAAAGAVGQVVCQIAQNKDMKVVAAAGGPAKCAFLREELGVEAVIDYKAAGGWEGLTKALMAAAPKGIDVYFENVGGDHLIAALECLNQRGRIVACGMIEYYNATLDNMPNPPFNLVNIVGKSLRMEGFIVTDHLDVAPAALSDLQGWFAAGKLRYKETIDHGVEAAPGAFIKLFTGENFGKMLVKLNEGSN